MTDELDLIGALGDAEPLRPEAYQRARSVLRAAMTQPGTVRVLGETATEKNTMENSTMEKTPVHGQDAQRRRGTGMAGRVGIGAGVGVAAAAVVVALALHSSAGGTTAAPVTGSTATATATASSDGPLVTLAAYIAKSTPATGDGWLVKATQAHGGKTAQVVYTLYTDSKAIYTGDSVAAVKRAIARHQDQSSAGGFAPLVKAAVLAATESPADGRTAMLQAAGDPLAGLDGAALKAAWDKQQALAAKTLKEAKHVDYTPKPYSAEAVRQHLDNSLWSAGTEALSAGEGDTRVRQGVLRLLSTISGVTVAKGSGTLTITAGSEVFGGEGSEVLTVDAETGMLVKDVSTTSGVAPASTTYESSRVTAAKL